MSSTALAAEATTRLAYWKRTKTVVGLRRPRKAKTSFDRNLLLQLATGGADRQWRADLRPASVKGEDLKGLRLR